MIAKSIKIKDCSKTEEVPKKRWSKARIDVSDILLLLTP